MAHTHTHAKHTPDPPPLRHTHTHTPDTTIRNTTVHRQEQLPANIENRPQRK